MTAGHRSSAAAVRGEVRSGLTVAGGAARRGIAEAFASDPDDVVRGLRIDPHWRRREAGGAARLAADEVIAPSRPIGRWRGVETRRPNDAWRSVSVLGAFGGWAVLVAAFAWVGWRRGRGPLAPLARLDELGSDLSAALDRLADAGSAAPAGPAAAPTAAEASVGSGASAGFAAPTTAEASVGSGASAGSAPDLTGDEERWAGTDTKDRR